MRMSKASWQSFGDWLNGGAPGILPWLLFLALGPVWRVVPLAQRAAEAFGPWLLALLEARQRAGLALPDDADILFQDIQARPLTHAGAERERVTWAQWRLEAELLRLVRLVEAPTALLHRSGWSEWEVRYWAARHHPGAHRAASHLAGAPARGPAHPASTGRRGRLAARHAGRASRRLSQFNPDL